MKPYHIRFCAISLEVLIILSLVVGCTNAPANAGPAAIISNAFPPVTPLACSNNSNSSGFVKQDKTQFIYKNSPLKFYGYTFYPTALGGSPAWRQSDFTHYIDHVLDLGALAGQNLIRTTDFWDQNYVDNRQEDVTIWKNLDYLVCMAKQRGIFVEMDVSAFSWFLISQKQDPLNAEDWKPFLEAVGKHYRNQSSIAFYSLLGEPTAPTTVAGMNTLVNFYRAVTDDMRAADGNHLIMAGGFNHMEDESPAIPWWHTIYALPNNDIVGFKTYSQDDLNLMPRIAAYAKQLGKPLVDEEFGMPQSQGDEVATGRTYNGLQISRSAFYRKVYTIGEANGVVGFIFWNLGCVIGGTHYEVSPDTSAVWHVIQQHAPEPLTASNAQQACSF
jgi:endo-1,4-beta-mannosidase